MPLLHIVHCIDTEGPLKETLKDTFSRINKIYKTKLKPTKSNLVKIQNRKINLGNNMNAIAEMVSPKLLNYNYSWKKLNKMLKIVSSNKFRKITLDSYGNGWKYSWHCLDHFLKKNPRRKTLGYGKIFNFYKNFLKTNHLKDELNWHFHPLSINQNPLAAATSYNNSMGLLTYIMCRRIIDHQWFPVVNRPGFHSIRPDSHLFLEQWIPFDYSNQSHDEINNQLDLSFNRFGDWSRAPTTWSGYHPDIKDYQKQGYCNRIIFRCLNLGTRLRNIREKDIIDAFNQAKKDGKAILAIATHDFRDFSEDLISFKLLLKKIKNRFKNVNIKFSGAEEAAKDLYDKKNQKLKFKVSLKKNRVLINLVSGSIFGAQPFLAIKDIRNNYYHDNLDVVKPEKIWSYVLDEQTIEKNKVSKIGVGSAGKYGGYYVKTIDL
jgi:hypothetical protein